MSEAERDSATQQNNDKPQPRSARPVAHLAPSNIRPPEFLKVRTRDLASVGPLGAAVLALVRYMTSGVGGADGRRSLDGDVWWRASMADIGTMLGGSVARRTVSTVVLQLTESGRLQATPTRDFHGDRAKAYRAPDLPLAETAQGSEQPLAESAQAIGQNVTSPLAEFAQAPCANSANAPIQLELTEESRRTEGRSEHNVDSPAVPGKANNSPKAKTTRGTRLDPAWMPPPDVIAAMRAECPDVDLRAEHRKFVDYWTDKTGAAATKRSWVGTWRNWVRRAAEQQAGHRSPARPKSKVRDWAEFTQTLPETGQQQPSRKAIEQ